MGFFSNLFKRADKGAKEKPPAKTMRALSSFLPRWLRGDYTLANSELIFSAVSRIANSLSAMPMKLYMGTKPISNDLSDLVGFEPNPTMTACQFFRTLEACRCTSGNGYALKVFTPDRTEPYLYVLDPDRVKPIIEKDSRELWYRITPEDGSPYYVHNYYVIHVPFISANGYQGVSPISVLQKTLSFQGGVEEFSVAQLEKGISAQVVLEAPANLGETQKKQMIEAFQDTYKTTGGNILLLESGVVAKPLTLSPVDAKLFEIEKMSRSRVAMVYNIPTHLLGDFVETPYTSQEQKTLELLSMTMIAIVTLYEQVFTRSLISRDDRIRGMRFRMDINAILRADAKTMSEVHVAGVRGGYITPNEARADDGRPEDPNGGHLLVSKDLTTLDYVVKHPDGAKLQNSTP
jgi:HK97 family phage portal protein